MRTCTSCGRTLDLAQFNLRNLSSGRRRWDCKQCSRRYHREHYANNKQYYSDKARARHPRERDSLRALVLEYLLAHPCVECGEGDPTVLEFDHTEPSQKR